MEKRAEHERYLACSLYLIAESSPKGSFESQTILNKVNEESVLNLPARAVFKTCAKLWRDGHNVDLGALIAQGKAYGIEAAEISTIVESSYTHSSWEYHTEELAEIIEKRRVLTALEREMSNSGTKSSEDIKSALNSVLLESVNDSESLVNSAEVEAELFGMSDSYIPTCIINLDDALGGGFEKGQLITMACRPGGGKTSVAVQMATNRMEQGLETIIVNMEMKGSRVYSRIMAQKSGITLNTIKNCRQLGVQAVENCKQVFYEIRDKVIIHDKGDMSLNDIKQAIQAAIFQCEQEGRLKPELMIVDYLQLIKLPKEGNSTNDKIGALSRGLKCIAMDLGICVVVLSQLSRDIEKRPDSTPKLSDLRDSGAIEADSNKVIFVHRPAMFNSDLELRNEEGQLAELIVAKNREGAVGGVPISFYPKCGKWI